MRFFRRSLFLLGAACTLVGSLFGQTVRVLSVSGEATIQMPGEAAPRAVQKGDTVVVGARIITGDGARVIITPLPGVNSIIAPKSDVVIERVSETRAPGASVTQHTAVLDLRTGAVTTDLQKREGVALDYGVRTARGLAGARGTTYTIGVNEAGVQTVVVADGVITLTLADGRIISLVPGQVSITRPDGSTQAVSSAAELAAAEQDIADNWVETTLDSLAEAVDQGIEIDEAALDDAIRSARDLGIEIDDDTQAKLERARQRQLERRERREAKATLQEKLEDSGGGTDDSAESENDVNTQEQSEAKTSTAFDFAAFIATFPSETREQFFALSANKREALAAFIGRLTTNSDRSEVLLYALGLQTSHALPAYLARSDSIKTYLAKRSSDTELTYFASYPYGDSSVYPSDAVVRFFGGLNETNRAIFRSFEMEVQERVVSSSDPQVREYAFELIQGEPHSNAAVAFFLDLTTGQRGRFLDLTSQQQQQLMASETPALVAYVLASGRTDKQVEYAMSLDLEVQLPAFLALSSSLQARLITENDPALTEYALNTLRTAAEINFAADLDTDRRTAFFGLSSDTQAILVAKASDADFLSYALDEYGEGQTRSECDILFVAALTASQRANFLDLDANIQDGVISANNTQLTNYVLANGRTRDEAGYAVSLSSERFSAFLGLSGAVREVLVDGADDTALQEFAYGDGSTPRAASSILYFDQLNDTDRALYLLRAHDLQDAVAVDDADLEDLLFSETTPGVFEYSDATLRHYLQLGDSVKPTYLASAVKLREKFAEVNRPGLTGAILTPGSFETTPSDSDVIRNLDALLALSPANQVLFETFAGGPAYSKLDSAPGPIEWSDAAWTRTRNSFESLPEQTRARVLSLGAIQGIFDYSGTFIEAAFADYDSSLSASARAAAAAAGWGRDFADYFVRDDVRQIFAEAANFTAAELAVLKQFKISPRAFLVQHYNTDSLNAAQSPKVLTTSVIDAELKNNLAALAALSAKDRSVLLSLGVQGDVLNAFSYGYYDDNGNYIVPTFADTLANTIGLADRFSGEELGILSRLGVGPSLLGLRDGGSILIGESSVDPRDLLEDIITIYETLTPEQRDAAIDTGVFAGFGLTDYRIVFGSSLAPALDAWLELNPNTRDFLAGEMDGDFNLLNLVEGTGAYRDLAELDALIASLTPVELGALRDLGAGKFLLSRDYYYNGLIDSAGLKAFLAYTATLTDPQIFAMRELGILSSENQRNGLFASDQEGLTRLLQAYAELDRPDSDPDVGNVLVATRQIDPNGSYTLHSGRSFFFANDSGSDYVTYNVSFESPGNLYVGAVRRLSLYGSYGESFTFAVPNGKDVALRASTLIDLQSVSFSAGVRAITMEAATINLAYLDFPEGSVLSLNSKLGGMGTGNRYPNFGPSLPGRVNFIDGVTYGGALMDDEPSFDSASRGNISVGTLQNRAPLPTYQAPPSGG